MAYLALVAIPLLGYEVFTLAGWLGDGPAQITEYRDHGSTSWYAARVLEAIVVLSVAGFVWHAVRERRRLGRLGTDALLIIGMFTAAFWDPVYNWLTPAWLYSSNWLNVNDWLEHAPLIVNPDAGQMPWPVIVVGVGYPLWGVGFAAVVNLVMTRTREHHPQLSGGALAVLAFLVAGLLTVASFSIFKAFDLMNAPGYRMDFLGDSQLAVLLLLRRAGVRRAGLPAVLPRRRGPNARRAVGVRRRPRARLDRRLPDHRGRGLGPPDRALQSPLEPVSGGAEAPDQRSLRRAGRDGHGLRPVPGEPGVQAADR